MTDIRIKIKKNNGEDLELGKEWIDDLTVLSQSSSNPSDINYEMLASSGSIDLRDLDGELEHYIKTGEIDDSSLPIQIYIMIITYKNLLLVIIHIQKLIKNYN